VFPTTQVKRHSHAGHNKSLVHVWKVLLLLLSGKAHAFLKPFDTSFHSGNKPFRLKYTVHEDVFDLLQLSWPTDVPAVGAEEGTRFSARRDRIQRSTLSSARWGLQGLSSYQRAVLSKASAAAYQRQAVMTGRDPLTLSIRDSPTLEWLLRSSTATDGVRPSTSQLYVNGTALAKSRSSLERFSWLQDPENDDGWFDMESQQNHSRNYYSMNGLPTFT